MKAATLKDSEKVNIKRSTSEKFFDGFNIIFMIIWGIVTIYPFRYILVMSFNTGADAAAGPIWFWPRKFTLENYAFVFQYERLQTAFYVILGAFGFFTMVVMRTHIKSLPIEMQESAMIDGAGYTRIFFQIIVPLCKPVIAAFLFFGVVGNWLDYYTNLIYVTNKALTTVQFFLYEIITRSEASALIDFSGGPAAAQRRLNAMMTSSVPTPEVIRMTVMVVVTFPIIFVYPFFQKYFASGMLTGAVKA